MNKMRIISGEFEGEMLHDGVVVRFWAIRNEFGLQASFETPMGVDIADIDLFRTLEALVYGH